MMFKFDPTAMALEAAKVQLVLLSATAIKSFAALQRYASSPLTRELRQDGLRKAVDALAHMTATARKLGL